MAKTKMCDGWCTPVQIYIALAIISVSLSLVSSIFYDNEINKGQNIVALTVGHIIGVSLWSYLLYMLCRYCYVKTAWGILLFPYVLMFIILVFLFISMSKMNKDKQ